MSQPNIFRRWFEWDVANLKGTMTAMVSLAPAALVSWMFGAYSSENAIVWWPAFAFAFVFGGWALWRGFVYEWREWRSIERQIKNEKPNG